MAGGSGKEVRSPGNIKEVLAEASCAAAERFTWQHRYLKLREEN